MASKKVEMYAKKRYELDEIKIKSKKNLINVSSPMWNSKTKLYVNWETPKHYY